MEKVSVTFDGAVYALEAVKAACYRLSHRFAAVIQTNGSDIVCVLEFDSKRPKDEITLEVQELKKEVLDQDLRLRIKVETEPLRNLILAHAFSKTGLIGDEQVPTDPRLRD